MQGRVRFVIKFDPRLPNIRTTLKRAWTALVEDRDMKKVYGLLQEGPKPRRDAGEGQVTDR